MRGGRNPLLSLLQGAAFSHPVFGGHTWQRGMHDGEHQGPGAEGLPAHVGKYRNTEATQDETGIQYAAKGLGRESGTHNFKRDHWNWTLDQLLAPLPLAPASDLLPKCPPAYSQKCSLSHHESQATLLSHLLTWAKFLAT